MYFSVSFDGKPEEIAALASLLQERPSVYVGKKKLKNAIARQIEQAPTCDLVEELKKRDGVETSTFALGVNATVEASGPATVLNVID